jgi:TRAP-type C4-dicarboxylate transport system permease small subunit
MLNKLRLWLEEYMELIIMSFGTVALTAAFGLFVEAGHKDTLNSGLDLRWSLVLLIIGILLYALAGFKAMKRERKEREEDAERYRIFKLMYGDVPPEERGKKHAKT